MQYSKYVLEAAEHMERTEHLFMLMESCHSLAQSESEFKDC
jgi:hypothetical protein